LYCRDSEEFRGPGTVTRVAPRLVLTPGAVRRSGPPEPFDEEHAPPAAGVETAARGARGRAPSSRGGEIGASGCPDLAAVVADPDVRGREEPPNAGGLLARDALGRHSRVHDRGGARSLVRDGRGASGTERGLHRRLRRWRIASQLFHVLRRRLTQRLS